MEATWSSEEAMKLWEGEIQKAAEWWDDGKHDKNKQYKKKRAESYKKKETRNRWNAWNE